MRTRQRVGPTVLADLGVGTVVLDRYKMPGGDERTYTEEIAQAIFGDTSPLFATSASPSIRHPLWLRPSPICGLAP